jgi:ketosteroid isomerase-like protein
MRIAFVALAALAACAPAAKPPAESGPAGLDSTAARLAADSLGDRYEAAIAAGDAAMVGALFTEDATVSYFGFPTTTGRAGIQALYAGAFGVARPVSADVVVNSANGAVPGLITVVGTTRQVTDSAGTSLTTSWRWVAALRPGTDGQWQFAYSMAFPDSVTRK